jgi:hypothetical protein
MRERRIRATKNTGMEELLWTEHDHPGHGGLGGLGGLGPPGQAVSGTHSLHSPSLQIWRPGVSQDEVHSRGSIPSSAVPLQSSSIPLHSSTLGVGASQIQRPLVQDSVPEPQTVWQGRVPRPSSIRPLQSSSMPLQTSGLGCGAVHLTH